jgi:hypothetical protein
MRHSNSHSISRRAIGALRTADGYVDVLLGLARNQAIMRRRPEIELGRRSRMTQGNLRFAEISVSLISAG